MPLCCSPPGPTSRVAPGVVARALAEHGGEVAGEVGLVGVAELGRQLSPVDSAAVGQSPGHRVQLRFLCAEVDRTGEQGRAMGVYGPVVPVPTAASTLDRLIGLTGRDPAWTA